MIIQRIVNAAPSSPVPGPAMPAKFWGDFGWSGRTKAGRSMDDETAKRISTAYRCATILSDDIASMPLQVFNSFRSQITRIYPDAVRRNTAYLTERQPNRWMTPFIFKKSVMDWLIWHGNAFIWQPPQAQRELFILPAGKVEVELDRAGNLWYEAAMPDGSEVMIPDVEMVHLMINSRDGLHGRGVLQYARETLARQSGAHETQDEIAGNKLNPTAAVTMNGDIDKAARDVVKKSYLDAVDGGVVVFDNKIAKFETITMKPTDAQFLETINATDQEIANFFGIPAYKLGMGKQSYESNEQQNLEYLKSSLNPFLIQWEQAGNLKWFSEADQPFTYLKFNRDAILQTDSKTRTEILKMKIESGMLSPNQALAVDDQNGYTGGDQHYILANMAKITANGSLEIGTQAKPAQGASNG